MVRAATLKYAPPLDVMTRENLLVLLQASGKDLSVSSSGARLESARLDVAGGAGGAARRTAI